MTRTERDNFTFAVDAAVETLKGRENRERERKRKIHNKYRALVKEFGVFQRGYKRLVDRKQVVEIPVDSVTMSGLPQELQDFFTAQSEAGASKIRILAGNTGAYEHYLRIEFEKSDVNSAVISLVIQEGSENVDINPYYLDSTKTDTQKAACDNLKAYASVDHYDQRVEIGTFLLAIAKVQTEQFARGIAAGGKA